MKEQQPVSVEVPMAEEVAAFAGPAVVAAKVEVPTTDETKPFVSSLAFGAVKAV